MSTCFTHEGIDIVLNRTRSRPCVGNQGIAGCARIAGLARAGYLIDQVPDPPRQMFELIGETAAHLLSLFGGEQYPERKTYPASENGAEKAGAYKTPKAILFHAKTTINK